MKNIGKFKIKGKLRNLYQTKIKNKNKYYYRIKNKKVYIKKPKIYLFNNSSKKKSFDVYIDKNPKDTIPIKYKTLSDVKSTIRKLEKLFKNKKYSHKRIWQVGMIMFVRLRAMKGKQKQKALAKRYYKFLGKRTKQKGKNKIETFNKRKKMKFKIN